jgi:hypothetical protein
MSLIQLLAVGKSLCSINDRPSRYKMKQESLLPKFGPGRRPETFALTAGSQPGVAASDDGEKRTDARAGAGIEIRKQMTTIEVHTKSPPTMVMAAPHHAYPLGRWTMKNPFARKPVRASGLVQSELSLDTVQPVRNDLNDADLEAVPATTAGKATQPTAAPDSAPATNPPQTGARPLMGRLRARLFGRA